MTLSKEVMGGINYWFMKYVKEIKEREEGILIIGDMRTLTAAN